MKTNKGRVLLVDGNPAMAKFLKINLAHAGYDVIVVSDICKAEQAAATGKVDVVALESSATVESLEAVSHLRQILGCPVLVYGLGDFTDIEKDKLKADGYIDRFYEPQGFVMAIEKVMAEKPQCDN